MHTVASTEDERNVAHDGATTLPEVTGMAPKVVVVTVGWLAGGAAGAGVVGRGPPGIRPLGWGSPMGSPWPGSWLPRRPCHFNFNGGFSAPRGFVAG